MIQTLDTTIGLPAEKVRVLDAFRRARNLADYEGDPIEEKAVAACIGTAETLLADVRSWMKAHRSDLLTK